MSIIEYMEEESVLINKISAICDKYKAEARLSGANYNLFCIIGMENDEVKVHSKFVANLLNPRGSHGQGAFFLDHFLDRFNLSGFDSSTAKIRVERHIGKIKGVEGGRIDIDIWDKSGFHIIIENKIKAKDGKNQLLRYHNYGVNRCKNHRLIYLSLFGEMPDEEKSCKDPVSGKLLSDGTDYHRISYNKDIIGWLISSRDDLSSKALLREGISHYINLLKHLTNQSILQKMNKDIEKELLKPENVKNLANIIECINPVKVKLQKEFWDSIIRLFNDNNYITSTKTYNSEAVKKYYSNAQKRKYYGIEIFIAQKEGFSIRYGIRLDENIYGGFTIREGEKKINMVNNKPEYETYAKFVKGLDSAYVNNEHWLGWKVLQPNLNFYMFNEETCLNLSNMQETVTSMFDSINDEIILFKEEFKIE